MGLFLLVVNGAMLGLAALLVPGFLIDGFWTALFAAIIVSLTGMVANWFIGPKGQVRSFFTYLPYEDGVNPPFLVPNEGVGGGHCSARLLAGKLVWIVPGP